MLEKSHRSLDAARTLFAGTNYDFSSSRSYYAAFYAIEALLLTQDKVYSKHAGVISGFNEHFIKNSIFPTEYAKYISRLFRERHIGDYDFGNKITREYAQKDYKIASELVAAIGR